MHNFRVKYSQELPEIGATLWRMEYEKNGADLIWLERNDENKTFAIAFKTIPEDDTGVFHILEHSVLNGSKKYPIKEPFVELIKSSMATFINAMTFADKTMYPVSSKNPKDFLNLMDVYMDAVFNPLSISDPHAFRQEGWHYELENPQDELKCNGVVYSEMKGAFASSDTVMFSEMNRQLFPDNCYGYVSGGDPDHIPELTYENYLASHRKFYHPSNSRIILDGNLDIDAALKLLDGYLCEYDRLDIDVDIPYQKPVCPQEKICSYEIGPEEDDKNKAILAKGWVFGDYKELEKSLAFSVLTEALSGSNESPLTKAVLDAGLADDVSFIKDDGIMQLCSYLVIRNCDPENRERIWEIVDNTVKKLASEGLDHKQLYGILNRIEFSTREKDFGSMPVGLVYAIMSLESWLYGGDPAANLCYDELFASLRKKVEEGWFEKLLKETIIDNLHCAKLCMMPSRTLGDEKRKKESERLLQIKSEWSSDRISEVISQFKALRERQETPDTPEQLAALPALELSDIPKNAAKTAQTVFSISDVTVLHQPLKTDGIIYLNLYFSLADTPIEKLGYASFLTDLIGHIATENFSALELSGELQSCLGRFDALTSVFADFSQTDNASPYIAVKLSLLEKNKADAVRLIDEILNRSRFDDKGYICNILRQQRIWLEQSVISRGDSYAARHTLASFSAKGAVSEAMDGIDMLRFLQKSDAEYESSKDEFISNITDIYKKVFSKNRLTVSITGEIDEDWLCEIIDKLGESEMGAAAVYNKKAIVNSGFAIPAEIGFASIAANLRDIGGEFTGAARVAAQLLTYDYLWNDIRVKGGAYGTRLSIHTDGETSFTSYRDPSPARSIESFYKCGEMLRKFCESGSSPDKYIISTIAAIEPLLTPRAAGEQAAVRYLCGRTFEDVEAERSQILGTTNDDLLKFSFTLDKICSESGVCVVGGKNVLDALGGTLDCVEALQ